jgi:nitroreductase/NAD-dependent dihydropyrimidine dehydrogenase PreA subunit
MMTVDRKLCIGCGKCIKDCFPADIVMEDNCAKIKNKTCIECGHCIAICPTNAITTDHYDMDEVVDYSKETFDINAENLLNFIKFRRTIRQFKDKAVEVEKITQIIEAGRFTQTAANMQDVSYVVVKDQMDELKELTFEGLKNMAEQMLANLTPETMSYRRYAMMWIHMYEAYKANPVNDNLFFNAPTLIIVTGKTELNGALASSNMELMTNALGLGTFFSGFFTRVAKDNDAIKKLLGISEDKEIITCMVIGYPDVTYKRTVPRKAAEINWV